ncbi:hypothetical protein Tsubulata_011976 [Turnera subulata]|uniref:Uncharacterized protein n=1 Tax=Turnera subulata TaxID=218843 RepID=A0A9Q0J6J5_9ROSI|nr:hypothetical protein Tsubulata_011976 [Turnera subulata]
MVGYLVWLLDSVGMLIPVLGVYRIPSGSDIPNIRLACCCLWLGYTKYPVVRIYRISGWHVDACGWGIPNTQWFGYTEYPVGMLMPVVGVYRIPSGSDIPNIWFWDVDPGMVFGLLNPV